MAKCGRRPLPREVKLAKGTLRKCRETAVPLVVAKGAPDPPANLPEYARPYWESIVSSVRDWDILCESDASLLNTLAIALAHHDQLVAVVDREGYAIQGEKNVYKNPSASALHDLRGFIRQALSEFGMSPSSRGRIEGKKTTDTPTAVEKFFA